MPMKYIFTIFTLSLLYSSCSIQRKLYSPTQVNNPSLQAKKDHSLSLTFSIPSGFDFTGGYAITNRLALIGGVYSYKNKDKQEDYSLFSSTRDSAALSYKHKGFHAGVGIYIPLSQKKLSTFISFFGGYTKGNFEMREAFYEISPTPSTSPKLNFYKSDINRWFIQGGINLYHKFIHQSFITRFNYVGYSNVNTDYTFDQQTFFNLPPLVYPKWSSFLDFSFDTKIFFSKNQMVGLQIFGTVTTRLNKEDYNFIIYPFRLGAGIVFKSPFNKHNN